MNFELNPRISIIVPTWNTPKRFLVDMVESVLAQTYNNWELCIADGASKEDHVKKVLAHYAKKDNRIKVKYLSENKGIAGNSNEAISITTGDYIALLDHDDTLAPFALFEVVKAINENPKADFIYSDEDKISEDGNKRLDPHFKPDWSPDTLRSYNYIAHLSVIKKELLDEVGWFREGFEGSQDYDLILRCTEKAKKVVHIPKILYHWRMSQNSTAKNPNSKLYAYESGKKAIKEHLERSGLKGTVNNGAFLGSCKIDYEIINDYKISIIIPNHNHKEDLEKCINSILTKSTYQNYEIIIVENHSTQMEVFEYYDYLQKKHNNISILEWREPFNYSAVNNFAVKYAKGDILLFLNNDTEIINENWLEEMIQYAQRKDVGVVGAKLYYPDDTIQHGGIIIGVNGIAEHAFRNFPYDADGYAIRLKIVHNLSAVSGACLMTKKTVFDEVNGFDENFPVVFNDIDFCLKVRQKGYLIVWTPYAKAYHYESKTRGYKNTPEHLERLRFETQLFKNKWNDILLNGDPYYNPNLTLSKTDFSFKNYVINEESFSINGIFYLRIGLIDDAKEQFNLALKENQFNIEAQFCLGALAINEERFTEAIERFIFLLKNNLINNNVNLACVYNNLGIALFKIGKTKSAIALINKAHNLNSYYFDAKENIEKIKNSKKDFKVTRKLIC